MKYADSECNSSVATIAARGQCGPDFGKDGFERIKRVNGHRSTLIQESMDGGKPAVVRWLEALRYLRRNAF